MKLTQIAAIVAMTAFPFVHAQAGESYCLPVDDYGKAPVCDPTGYIFAYGGYSFEFDRDVNQNGNLALTDQHDGGYLVGAGIGVYSDWLCGSRFEIEGIHGENEFAGYLPNGTRNGLTGQTLTNAVLFNVLKEIPLGCVTGYIGGGVGYASSDIKIDGTGANFDSDALAYQFIAGGDIPVSDCVSFFTQYKLLGIGDEDLAQGVEVDNHYIHSVSAGLRFSF